MTGQSWTLTDKTGQCPEMSRNIHQKDLRRLDFLPIFGIKWTKLDKIGTDPDKNEVPNHGLNWESGSFCFQMLVEEIHQLLQQLLTKTLVQYQLKN